MILATLLVILSYLSALPAAAYGALGPCGRSRDSNTLYGLRRIYFKALEPRTLNTPAAVAAEKELISFLRWYFIDFVDVQVQLIELLTSINPLVRKVGATTSTAAALELVFVEGQRVKTIKNEALLPKFLSRIQEQIIIGERVKYDPESTELAIASQAEVVRLAQKYIYGKPSQNEFDQLVDIIANYLGEMSPHDRSKIVSQALGAEHPAVAGLDYKLTKADDDAIYFVRALCFYFNSTYQLQKGERLNPLVRIALLIASKTSNS